MTPIQSTILDAAVRLAEECGYPQIQRREVALAAGVPESLVSYHFGNMAEFRGRVLSHAVRLRNLPVIAQGLAFKAPECLDLPRNLKAAAAAALHA